MSDANIEKFTCRNCGQEKDSNERHKGTPIGINGKSRCKSCHNAYNLRVQQEARLLKRPEDYFSCEDCERIFYYKNKSCPECKSEKFDDYIS